MFTRSFTAAVILSLGYILSPVIAQQPTDNPAAGLNLKTPTYMGCYSSAGTLQDQGPYTFQALGWCQPLCVRRNSPVLAFFNGTNCWCGDKLPPASDKVDDAQCSTSCDGYQQNTCGGPNAYQVYSDGLADVAAVASSSPSPTPMAQNTPSPTDTSPTVVRIASTVFVTAPGETSAHIIYTTEVAQASTGTNKTAIAVGSAVGVVALLAILGGFLFWLRQRKRKALEEEQRRSATVNPFADQSEMSRSAIGSLSTADSRLEPSVMFQRRLSDGSIADNQDYSRRILKVANPDGI